MAFFSNAVADINELYENGYTPAQIAETLNLEISDVLLVIWNEQE